MGRPRVLDCNSTGHLYNLRPRSLKSAFPGGWGKGKKKKTSLTKDEIALEQRREKVSGGVRGRRRKQGGWRKSSMRSLLMTLEFFAPTSGAGLLLPPDGRQSPPDPGLQVYPIACLSMCLVPSHVRIFVTPWTVTCQALLSRGILQARKLEWVAISFSKGSSPPWDQTRISCVSRIAGKFLTR